MLRAVWTILLQCSGHESRKYDRLVRANGRRKDFIEDQEPELWHWLPRPFDLPEFASLRSDIHVAELDDPHLVAFDRRG